MPEYELGAFLFSSPQTFLCNGSQASAFPILSMLQSFQDQALLFVQHFCKLWLHGTASHASADHKDSVKAQFHTVNSISHRYHYFIRQRDSKVIRGIVEKGGGEEMEKEDGVGWAGGQNSNKQKNKTSHKSRKAAQIPEQMTPYLGHCSQAMA